tara:strand:- start:1528 stop:2391 length:864 start_codon:yes stop_codon:yes gene_type:complete
MSYIKSLPKTTFKLYDGTVVPSVNIFKSFVFSDNLKNSNSTKKVFYDQIKRLEYVAYSNYSKNSSLYWVTVLLNDIDSFRKIPYSQSIQNADTKKELKGMVYYIKGAKNISGILPGDVVLLRGEGDGEWKSGGVVKEYDSIFRRVVIVKEGVTGGNPENPPVVDVYRDGVTTGTTFELGRTENEYDKVIKIYEIGFGGNEVSPFQTIDGTSFDFTDEPTDTIGVSLAANELSADVYRVETELDRRTLNNAEYKNMKFTSTSLAFKLSSFLSRIPPQNLERGQTIRVK